MLRRMQFAMAADGGGGGGRPVLDEPVSLLHDTLPDEEVAANDDDLWGVELADDTPADMSARPDLIGKTQAELLAEIQRRDVESAELKARVDPAQTLSETMKAFMQAQKPAPAAVPEGYRVKPAPSANVDPDALARYNKQLTERFIDDPVAATREVATREMLPILTRLAENQAMQSRTLVRLDPDTKDIYAKYASEIEADVAEADALAKLNDPQIYQKAVERARARHFNELVSETTQAQQEVIAANYLKSLGLDLESVKASAGKAPSTPQPARAAASTLARAGMMAPSASTATKARVVLTPAQRVKVESFARSRGVSAEAAAAHLRDKGEL